MANTPTKQVPLTPADYTQHPKVQALIEALKVKFGENLEGLVVSDTLDKDGNQYVHLVQEGGGVLGIALVGYTYILEQCGIRFFRLAGTSAGAINTMMLAVIGKKNEPKSEKVLEYISNKNLFDFVDGHPFAKKLIGNLVTSKGYMSRVKRRLIALVKAIFIFIMIDFVSIGMHHYYPEFAAVYLTAFVITGILITVLLMIVGYLLFIVKRFKISGFGINPGDDFLEWITNILEENEVSTNELLMDKVAAIPDGLRLRPGRNTNETVAGLVPDITLITSDIISQNKIEFPKMWNLFSTDKNRIHPAEFVRASMSIPVFFESYEIKDIPTDEPEIIKAWYDHLRIEPDCIPDGVRFVDGGIISNFPISLFFNPKVVEPRMPTFGIDLDDEEPKEPGTHATMEMSLGTYVYRMFNTVRFYYDKDFLIKNELYKKGIGKIKVYDFNWLNFGISEGEKQNLFIRGAEAASEFLLGTEEKPGFNWEEYKRQRIEVHEMVSTTSSEPSEKNESSNNEKK